MDQMMVDVTDIDGAAVGDVATIIGGDGDEFISADEVARLAGTIGYEIVCGISKRVPRVYMEDGEVTGVLKMLRD
jgi:alanine racemase